MERKQFLKSLGAGAAFAIAFPCVHACSKDEGEEGGNTAVPTGVDFTVDLNAAEGKKLAENGGFIFKNLVVVAKNLDGNFVAASQVCSHQGYEEVRFANQDGGIFYCDVHGSRFEQNGSPLNQVDSQPAKSLKIFKTELSGSVLRVFE
jgi:Rieske Fe-S protein